jgi:hypothetical protein
LQDLAADRMGQGLDDLVDVDGIGHVTAVAYRVEANSISGRSDM